MREIQDLRPAPEPDELPGGPSGLLTLAAFPPAGYESPKIDPEVASVLDKVSTVFDEMAPIDGPTAYFNQEYMESYKDAYKLSISLTKNQQDAVSQIQKNVTDKKWIKDLYKTTGKMPYKNQIWNNTLIIDGDGIIVSSPLTFAYNRMLYSNLIMNVMSFKIMENAEGSKVNLACCHDAFLRGLDKVSDYKGDISKGYMELNMPFMRFMALVLSIRMMFSSDSQLEAPVGDPVYPNLIPDYINGDDDLDVADEEDDCLKTIISYLGKHSEEVSKYAVPLTKIVDGKLEQVKYNPVTSILAMANIIMAYYQYRGGSEHGNNIADPLLNIPCVFNNIKDSDLMFMYKPASVRTPEFIQAVDKLAKDHPEVWQPALTEDGNAIKRSNAGFILSKYLPANFERPFKKYYHNHEGLYKEFEPFDGFYNDLEKINDTDSGYEFQYDNFDIDELFNQLDSFFGRMLDNLTDDDFRIPIHIYGISDTYGPTGYDADNTPMFVTKQPDGTYVKDPIVPHIMRVLHR